MSDDAGGFLARWSRRKAGVAEPVAAEPAPVPVPPLPPPVVAPAGDADVTAAAEGSAPVEPPLPTMADVALLTRESDFSRFVLPGVTPGVKNAALKKLFSDPHFNVMDRLDTYIDDYGIPDPMPLSMLRALNQSAALGLFDADEGSAQEAAPAQASPDGEAAAAVAQSDASEGTPAAPPEAGRDADTPAHDDDADLRLQQDDPARRSGPRPRPGD